MRRELSQGRADEECSEIHFRTPDRILATIESPLLPTHHSDGEYITFSKAFWRRLLQVQEISWTIVTNFSDIATEC